MKFSYLVTKMKLKSKSKALLLIIAIAGMINFAGPVDTAGQVLTEQDTSLGTPSKAYTLSTGWGDEAAGIGYVTAPSVLVLTLVSAMVNEWNAGYFGIPASAMILAAPPLIYFGGRSVDISKEILHPRAKLGWTLYALSVIPASLALYSYVADWGASLPLMITSGVLGTASIVAMTSYAFARTNTARQMKNGPPSAWNFGIAPLAGGALCMLSYQF